MAFNISIKKESKTIVSIEKDNEKVFEYEIQNNKGSLVIYKQMLISDIKRLINIYRENIDKLNVINLYLQIYSKKVNTSKICKDITASKNFLEKIKENFSIKKNNDIKGVIANIKVFPQVNGEGITIYTMDILRNDSLKWERIYKLETGMYNEDGKLKSINEITDKVMISENDILNLLNMLNSKEELEVMDSYLKNLNNKTLENFSYCIKY